MSSHVSEISFKCLTGCLFHAVISVNTYTCIRYTMYFCYINTNTLNPVDYLEQPNSNFIYQLILSVWNKGFLCHWQRQNLENSLAVGIFENALWTKQITCNSTNRTCNYELFNTEFKTVAQSGFEIVQDRCNHVTTDLIFVNAISCSRKRWEVIVQPANDAPLKKKVFEATFSAVLCGCEAWFNLPLNPPRPSPRPE